MNTRILATTLLAVLAISTLSNPAHAQENQLPAPEPADKPLTIEVTPGSTAGVDIELELGSSDIGDEVSVTVKGGADCTVHAGADKITISDCAPAAVPVAESEQLPDESSITFVDDDEISSDYRGGSLRLGAFAIQDMKSRAYFGPDDLPIAGLIDLERNLGLKDSITAFRGNFTYRFSKRHGITVGHYRLDRTGTISLSETVTIGETDFDIGFDIRTRHQEQITKLSYNFIFHDEGKVLMSITPGIHFSDFKFSIESIGPFALLDLKEDESVAAPLPMLGTRLIYRINPKWSVTAVVDVFFLNSGSQEGSLTDAHIFAEYKINDRFKIGGGFNRFALNMELVEKGILWDLQSVYTGTHLFLGFDF